MKNTSEIKYYVGRKRIKDFIVIVRNGKIQRFKIFEITDGSTNAYILPRQIDESELEDFLVQCSACQAYFPDGLNSCEHCDENFCCDCAIEHSGEINTGGCNF